MKNWYEVGKVYVWQNQVGQYARLNGTETTVTGPAQRYFSERDKVWDCAQPTDTPPPPEYAGCIAMAYPGDLRPKNPPPGELSVLELFKQPVPELEPA